ncbi:DUF1643 domain-containing protein [Bacteroidota bacterium]
MARIGRQIPHFDLVDTAAIQAVFSSDMLFRYILSMKYMDTLLDSGRTKAAAVILKNPSAANQEMADATIRKVETYIYHCLPEVRELHILNIFAFRATEPEDLNTRFILEGAMAVIGEENDHVIHSTLSLADYIILAWGNNSGIDSGLYDERIFRVKQLIKEFPKQKIFRVCGSRQTKHPLHGLMWGYDYTIEPIGAYIERE